MTGRGCEDYRLDADRFDAHAATCEDCRRLSEQLATLDRNVTDAVAIEPRDAFAGDIMSGLPIAPWEGSGFRAWLVVLAGAASIAIGAVLVFLFMGISPIEGFISALSQRVLPRLALLDAGQSLATILGHASMKFHFVLGVSFVIVNVVFVLLLRRPPRGYDAPR